MYIICLRSANVAVLSLLIVRHYNEKHSPVFASVVIVYCKHGRYIVREKRANHSRAAWPRDEVVCVVNLNDLER